MTVLVEGCVESLPDAQAAARGGADRLELCANLDVGGTTPPVELVRAVKGRVFIPVFVMVRPRGGSFVHGAAELETMRRAIDEVMAAGADGVVVGTLREGGEIDVAAIRDLVARAGGVPVTFHRAFDQTPDPLHALDQLVDAGVERVLTGGGTGAAIDGIDVIQRLVERAGDRISVMAGGKVRGSNARQLIERTGVRELHARCETKAAQIAEIVAAAREASAG